MYAGHHPTDSAEALEHLLGPPRHEAPQYLVVPATSAWWLEHYEEFAGYLDSHYARAVAPDGAYVVYDLAGAARVAA